MWRTIKTKVIFKHPRITLLQDEVELPDGSRTEYLKFEHRNDSVTVLCIKGSQLLMQKEYSHPTGKVLWQLPGGKINKGETPVAAANRELTEESGYKSAHVEELGWYYTDNRRSESKMHVVLVKEPVKTKQTGGDKEEAIESQWIELGDVEGMIKGGEIVNYSVLAAWSLLSTNLPN